jgi:hypothetical protein
VRQYYGLMTFRYKILSLTSIQRFSGDFKILAILYQLKCFSKKLSGYQNIKNVTSKNEIQISKNAEELKIVSFQEEYA